MIKKAMTILMAVLLVTVVLASVPVKGDTVGDNPRGGTDQSYDGQSTVTDDGSTMNCNISVIHPADPSGVDYANVTPANATTLDNDVVGTVDGWSWGASGSAADYRDWRDVPDTTENAVGQEAYWVLQNEVSNINYTSVTNHVIDPTSGLPDNQYDNIGQFERIDPPIANSTGSDWINLTLEMPDYTNYNNTASGTTNDGTYDNFASHAVFIRGGSYGSWTYLNNSELLAKGTGNGYDAPIVPVNDAGTDPEGVLTGEYYYNTSWDVTLSGSTDYEFMVRWNFNLGGANGGYQDGLGSFTTFGTSVTGGATYEVTTPTASEFPTVIVPVVATMTIFIAAVYYRRKRE